MLKSLPRAILVIVLSTSAIPSAAQPVTKSVLVHVVDLNLGSPDGQRVLRRRIASALSSVCGDIDPHDLARSASIAACRKRAMRDAQPQVESAIARAKGATAVRYTESAALAAAQD